MKSKLKLNLKRKLAPKKVEEDDFELPLQQDAAIQLVDTDPALLGNITDALELQTFLKDSKVEFVKGVEAAAEKFGLTANVRIYFTLKEKK